MVSRNLELAQVACILFIAGMEESLASFIATHATFMVDDIQGFAANIATSTRRTGCRIRSNPTKLPSPIAVSQQPIQPCHAIAGMA